MAYKVFNIGADQQISSMLITHEGSKRFVLVYDPKDADILMFPGGSDVNPELYGEKKIPQTHHSPQIDARDLSFFEAARSNQIKVGICRGGQFLNVINGGRMWQHVNNHTCSHNLIDFLSGKEIPVISTHHQMMITGPGSELLAAAQNQADLFCNADFPGGVPKVARPEWEPEVVWYAKSQSLCFQPHPEYHMNATREYFFNLLYRIL